MTAWSQWTHPQQVIHHGRTQGGGRRPPLRSLRCQWQPPKHVSNNLRVCFSSCHQVLFCLWKWCTSHVLVNGVKYFDVISSFVLCFLARFICSSTNLARTKFVVYFLYTCSSPHS
jgi:hypothetical protein